MLQKWLGNNMRIRMSDGRTLIGEFLCTDQQRNIILGSAQEYLQYSEKDCVEEPRMLGLAMIPGRHIESLQIDMPTDTIILHGTEKDDVGPF